MSPTIQTATALALVVGAALYFILGWFKKRKNPGCGGGCGCSASSKTKLGK